MWYLKPKFKSFCYAEPTIDPPVGRSPLFGTKKGNILTFTGAKSDLEHGQDTFCKKLKNLQLL